ncbi:hypothetical protein GCM10010172_07210 [Paractinoplanes ferrugineus]|uniref:Uncharacterized protein n=1 Tax=Paractinoplanes ferrugineus TaxID=113564 RepID=A0A919MLG4_9ACTN|nr:hypothetical protein [Actinoplanes ferrugineus]GIE16800.1 hypothetical protein Afe05nite_86400 [Actinoplanes ferrugineus]
MSAPTYAPAAGDFDDLAAFLATVPAAADYDRDELDRLPKLPKRPARGNDKRAAINASKREWR